MGRLQPKDVVDIHAIAIQNHFNWRELVTEAKSKEVGADPETIYDILNSFPLEYLKSIKWISRPDAEMFKHEIRTIADDILLGKDNSLAPQSAKGLQ